MKLCRLRRPLKWIASGLWLWIPMAGFEVDKYLFGDGNLGLLVGLPPGIYLAFCAVTALDRGEEQIEPKISQLDSQLCKALHRQKEGKRSEVN